MDHLSATAKMAALHSILVESAKKRLRNFLCPSSESDKIKSFGHPLANPSHTAIVKEEQCRDPAMIRLELRWVCSSDMLGQDRYALR